MVMAISLSLHFLWPYEMYTGALGCTGKNAVNVPNDQMAIVSSFPEKKIVTLWQINIDPENHQLLEETNLPNPICQGLC